MRVVAFSIVFLTIVIFLFISVTNVLAASFTTSVSPSSIDASDTDVFLNFTVNNTDAVNITKVEITMPAGFSYSGGVGSTASGTTFLIANNVFSWSNTTPVGIVASNTKEYFWFKVDTPSSTGNFDFNVSNFDKNGGFNSQNVTVTVSDQTAPIPSNNLTTPSHPTTYTSGQNYTFNITWTDNIAISHVIFEWDGATNYTNATSPVIIYLGSNRYSITRYDLTPANYTYKWYANDTSNLWNSTSSLKYEVKKAVNPINVYLNGILDQNITITNGTELNVTVTGIGDINLYENGALVVFGSNSVGRKTTQYATNKYNYTATVSGDQNRTSNSSTFFVMVVPTYTVTTNILKDYSSSTNSTFQIDFSSAPGFNLLIEGNWSGTVEKYNMVNSSTKSFSYSTVFSVGVFYWRIYGDYDGYIFNLTLASSFLVGKAVPHISLGVYPALTVPKGIQTNVTCYSNNVTVKLYRNDTLVTNQDVVTLDDGKYIYICNSTETSSFVSGSVTETLTIKVYLRNLTFTKAESLISLEQNSSTSTIVEVKNTGEVTQNVSFTILDMDSSWYTVNATNVTLPFLRSAAFLVTFKVGTVELKDYTGKYKAYSPNTTITSDFVLRVLPAAEKKVEIENKIKFYRVDMVKLWDKINSTKLENEGINATLAEEKISEAKEKIELAEDYIGEGNYFEAYHLLDDIESLILASETELSVALENYRRTKKPSWPMWVIVPVIVVVGVLVYLLWPQPGYDPRRRKYRFKTPQRRSMDKIQEAKEKLSRVMFTKPYTVPVKIPPKRPKYLKGPFYPKDPFEKPVTEKPGAEKPKPSPKPPTTVSNIKSSIQKILDRFGKKKKREESEVELREV